MKIISVCLASLLISGCTHPSERVLFLGFDASGTARHGRKNPYDRDWAQMLKAIEAGDHVYGAIINEKGLANGAPVIDFAIRQYSLLTDKRNEYDAAVQAKLEKQRQILDNAFKNAAPSQGTEIIGFLHAATQILNGYSSKAAKEVVIWTDGMQEGEDVNLAGARISDEQITKAIEAERQAGRLPDLHGISIWFVTGPSVESAQFSSSKLLRLEAFWRRYIQACGGNLKAFSPVLVNFGSAAAVSANAADVDTQRRSSTASIRPRSNYVHLAR